ncbi:MAG: chromosome segregation protein SMC [Treponema sp.]|nr:MAG: chromosome segregation protein SMC [Treponema sp.]
MFLKSLELFGFKSFPDRTRIEFADGITALLGPNGCGKSNVVDAIKWVLGEQSYKTLRAVKSEDVIFNGTETRKPLNVAEVTLTISNEAGLLDLDLTEIGIKRRLYRSGESEYFINNQPSKLRELKELFWDTGIGKVAYSVMEQGKIDQILSSRPEDRRYLFEEAAGITRFKVKRIEAERNLARTEENMKRVDGVLGEVKRSYDSLKIQAEKTKKYRDLRDKIFQYELDIQLLKLRACNERLHERSNDIEKTTQKRDELNDKLSSINNSLTENLDLINEMQEDLNLKQQNIFSIAAEQRTKKEQAKIYQQQKSDLKLKISALEGRKSGLEEKINDLQDDLDGQAVAIRNFKKKVDDIKKNIALFEENIKSASLKIDSNKTDVKNCESKIESLDNARFELEKQLHGITEDIVTELDEKLSLAGYSAKNRRDSESAVFNTLEQLKVLVNGRKNIFSDFSTISNPSASEVKQFLDGAVEGFQELSKITASLEENLKVYKTTSVGFIDEFLSPEGIITKKRSVDKLIEDNRNAIESNRKRISVFNDEIASLSVKIDDYNSTLNGLRINEASAIAQTESAEKQTSILKRELISQQNILRDLENDIFLEKKNFDENEEKLLELEGEINSLELKGKKLTDELAHLEQAITVKNSDLSAKKSRLTGITDELNKVQGRLENHFMRAEVLKSEIDGIKTNFRENHSRDLMEFEERMFKIKVTQPELRSDLAVLKQSLHTLGSVNQMAIEEFAEVKERFDFLTNQIADLKKAKDDLQRITDEIRTESTEIFLETYHKIKRNFHNMFRRLFGGGKAEIRLVDPKNVLESGIDIFAQPPGKRLENIGLLSGGEKSMTAVALLFATYMVKPSPFCFLDEIDAALDEPNVIRFITTLKEFANVSQYVVITHNKKTVLGANSMLGVTMQESGVSTVISVKLDKDSAVINETSKVERDMEGFIEEDVPAEEGIYIPPHPPKRIKKDGQEAPSQGAELE